MQFISNVSYSIRQIYSKPVYIAVNVIGAIIYYLLFNFIVEKQNHGVLLLISVPAYMLYALIATASIALTISIYSIKNTRRNLAKSSSSSLSALATVFGGLVNGCGCSSPLMFGVFSIFVGGSEAIYLDAFVSDNGIWITAILIVANLLLIGYYLNKFAKPSCNIRRSDGFNKKAAAKGEVKEKGPLKP